MCKQEGNATFSRSIDFPEPTLPDYAQFILRCIIFAVAHSLFASSRVKQAFGRASGGEPRAYRLAYNLASLAMFGWVMAAYRTSPLLYAVPGMLKWGCYSVQSVLAGAIFLCVRQTGSGDFLGTRQLRPGYAPSHRLITTGCYARVRHPLYLLSTLFLILNPVMTVKWLLLTLFSVTYFIIGGLIEERRLLKEFGEEYREYRQQVPFMLPARERSGHPPKA